MFDILNRLKSPVVIAWIATAIAFVISLTFKVQVDSTVLGESLSDFINALFAIVSIFATLNDPTNKKGF